MRSSKPWLYAAARAFDAMVGMALGRNARTPPAAPRRILVANIGHLGDALLTLGVPRALRRAYPDARVDVLVSSSGARLFDGLADVSSVFTHDALLLQGAVRSTDAPADRTGGNAVVPNGAGSPHHRGLVAALRERDYEIALELRSYVPNSIPLLARSGARYLCGFGTAGFSFLLDRVIPHVDGEHELHRFARAVSALTGDSGVREMPVPDLAHLVRNGRHERIASSPYTVLHPGTRRRRKRWQPDRWRHLAASLASEGRDVVVTGAPGERAWLESTFRALPVRILAGSLDVADLADLYRGSTAFVGVDSFPAHLAAAAGAPRVVVLWHAYADPAEWAPVGQGHVSVLSGEATPDAVVRALVEPA